MSGRKRRLIFLTVCSVFFREAAVGVITIGVCQDLRKRIAPLERQAVWSSGDSASSKRVVSRMAALITAALAGIDGEILRKRAQGLATD